MNDDEFEHPVNSGDKIKGWWQSKGKKSRGIHVGVVFHCCCLLVIHGVLAGWGISAEKEAYKNNAFDNNDCSLRTIASLVRWCGLLHITSIFIVVLDRMVLLSCPLLCYALCTLLPCCCSLGIITLQFFITFRGLISCGRCTLRVNNGIMDYTVLESTYESLSDYLWANFFAMIIICFTFCCGCCCDAGVKGSHMKKDENFQKYLQDGQPLGFANKFFGSSFGNGYKDEEINTNPNITPTMDQYVSDGTSTAAASSSESENNTLYTTSSGDGYSSSSGGEMYSSSTNYSDSSAPQQVDGYFMPQQVQYPQVPQVHNQNPMMYNPQIQQQQQQPTQF